MHKKHRITRRQLISTTATCATLLSSDKALAVALSDSRISLDDRRLEEKDVRQLASQQGTAHPYPMHPTNGDEEAYSDDIKYIGNFCKGLQQDPFGVVNQGSYRMLLEALEKQDPEKLAALELGELDPTVRNALTKLLPSTVANVAFRNDAPLGDRFYSNPDERIAMERENRLASYDATKSVPRLRFYRLNGERGATPDGRSQLVNPLAAFAFDLEATDSHSHVLPPPPRYDGEEIIGEIAENYCMALLRDTPFADIEKGTDKFIKDVIDDLNALPEEILKVPRAKDQATGKQVITNQTLFRGFAAGDAIGPYVSQFLTWQVPFGAYFVDQLVQVGYAKATFNNKTFDPVFLHNKAEWYASQLGLILPKVVVDQGNALYNYRPRELCNYVHIDELFQGYLNAELLLNAAADRGGMEVPISRGIYYATTQNQIGFGTLGQPNFATLVAEVATRALKAVWYQKWAVHRRLRPEAFAGHIHFIKKGVGPKYPINRSALKALDSILAKVEAFNTDRGGEGHFLPMAFRDGCPVHPSYGAGHATVAGACVTLLKAFYDETRTFGNLGIPIFVPSSDGKRLLRLDSNHPTGELMPEPNKAAPASPPVPEASNWNYNDLKDAMTIGGELDKLATNVSLARNFAGVHWRSDHAASLPLGERVAIGLLKEIIETYREPVEFKFTRFDGTPCTISKAAG